MTSFKEYQCEICGEVSNNPLHWLIIRCSDKELTVLKWDQSSAGLPAQDEPGARHYCGEAHAQVYISRWFQSHCTPPKPNY
jgi:hypothetical protein